MKHKFCILLLLAFLNLIAYSQSASSTTPQLKNLHKESSITLKRTLPTATPESRGIDGARLVRDIDSIANLGIIEKAYPGCVVLIARKGDIIFEKAYGTYNYDDSARVSVNSIFDMASVTKICATTLSVMKLYDEGKLRLDKSLGTYLPWVRNSDKENLNIEKILLHEARLVPDVVFYRRTYDSVTKMPSSEFFRKDSSAQFNVRVAQNLYLRNDYWKTMNQSIVASKLLEPGKY